MPTAPRLPSYRLHRPSGQAVVTLSGQDVYLGEFGSAESRAKYEQAVAEWLARGRTAPRSAEAADGPSINEVMLAYLNFAEQYYRDADGQPTREPETMKLAFRPLKQLYGMTRAAAFGPLALEAVQNRMIEARLSRNVINQRIGYIKRMFRWASKKEMIEPAVYHRLLCVDGLRRGRSAARETEPVRPVPNAHVDAILPFLPPTVRTMVELQRVTGMRSGELVRLRACDIDVTGPVWLYRPPKHKTAHLGKKREIPLGPKAKAMVEPFLSTDVQSFLFSPRRAEAERDAMVRAVRRTPVQPSQRSRKKANPKRRAGDVYDTRSYYAAVRYAMRAAEKAGVLSKGEFWHPHQLRHSAALRIQREHSLEAARAYLGHAKPDLTAHYAGLDTALAASVAERSG